MNFDQLYHNKFQGHILPNAVDLEENLIFEQWAWWSYMWTNGVAGIIGLDYASLLEHKQFLFKTSNKTIAS